MNENIFLHHCSMEVIQRDPAAHGTGLNQWFSVSGVKGAEA